MNVVQIITVVISALLVPVLFLLYMHFSEKISGRKRRKKGILPWLWLVPAFLILLVFTIYPIINTLVISFMNADSTRFIGINNYLFIFSDHNMLIALKNNLLWIIFFTLIAATLGLVLAVLTDRVRYEVVAKAVIFLPASISFVAAGIIWKFMYSYRPEGEAQIGTINALFCALIPGFKPQAWLFNIPFNNWALMIVGIWIWTGFALVIFSASLKGIPKDLIDAAKIDGAGEVRIFFRILLPLMSKTVTVVVTFFVITVLKIFDIIYVMTNGNLDTEVIANRMYKEMFNFRNFGRAGAIAVFLLVAIIPVLIANIKRFSRKKIK